MIRLLVTPAGEAPRLHSFEGDRVSIGSRAGNDLVLGATGVSKHHLDLEVEGGAVFLRDAGSSNGTYVDRARIEGRAALAPGARVEIPGYALELVAEVEEDVGRAPGAEPPLELRRRALRWYESGDPANLLARSELALVRAWRGGEGKVDALLKASEAGVRRTRWRRLRSVSTVAGALLGGILGGEALLSGGAQRFAEPLVEMAPRWAYDAQERGLDAQCERLAERAAEALEETLSADEVLQRAYGGLECANERGSAAALAVIEPAVRAALRESYGPTLDRATSELVAVAADASGCHFAWGSADGRLHRWNRCAGARRPRTDDLGAPVRGLVFAGGSALAVTRTGELFRWELGESGAPTQLERGAVSHPGAVALAADGSLVALAASEAPRLDLVVPGRASEGVELPSPAAALAISSDGELLAALDREIVKIAGRSRGGRAGRGSKVILTHEAAVSALRVPSCAGAAWVLSGGVDGQVFARPLRGRRPRTIELRGLRDRVDDLAISGDCRYVVAAAGRAALVWDLAARDPSAAARALDHDRPVFAVRVADDGAVVTAAGRSLRRWDLEAPTEGATLLRHGHAVVDFALTRGGREALVAFEDRSIRLWDLAASVAGAGASHLHHTNDLVAAAIDVEGERIVTASAQEALLWRRGEAGLELMRSLGGHESPIRGAAVAGDGAFGATVDEDGKVLLWPLGDADDVAPRSYVSVRGPRQLAFAGRHLVVAGDRGACVISPGDADERRCRELTVAGELGSLAVAPGVPKIALAGYDRAVTLLDLDAHARGGVANTLIKTSAAMAIVAMSADGLWIAAASESGALGVARAGEGALRELQSAGGIVALALSPRGEWLAVAEERAVHLYRPDARGAP
ncbi:MAG: FHA domain-containing protein, partial [Myxococcales bacterium]|nr:FHA domain-containing protein [Myxococcales bacterium]